MEHYIGRLGMDIVGIDLGKRRFHVYGKLSGAVAQLDRQITRSRLSEFVAQLPQCLIAMES